jgi:hypothetical protein
VPKLGIKENGEHGTYFVTLKPIGMRLFLAAGTQI